MERRMQVKKNVILCILGMAIILTLLITLYIKTDFLKSKEFLFWKYMIAEINDVGNVFSNESIEEYENSLSKSYYTKNGELILNDTKGIIPETKIKIDEKGNKTKKISNVNLALESSKYSIPNLKIIRNESSFYIKKDNDDKYIKIENNNLKDLARRMGIGNTDFIPNQLREIDFSKLFSITDSEKNNILKRYVPVCRKTVKNHDYSKKAKASSEEGIMSYKVDISDTQMKELVINILEELKQDDVTLQLISNKIKYIDSENMYVDIGNLKEKINQLREYMAKIETTGKEFLSINMYVKEKNVIKTEFVLKNERNISIEVDKNSNKLIVKQYDIENRTLKFDTEMNIIKSALDSITKLEFSRNIVNMNESYLNLSVNCNYVFGEAMLEYNSVECIKNEELEVLNEEDIEYNDIVDLDVNITF